MIKEFLDELGGRIPAPEFPKGNWINSEPLKIKDLKGKVVLIDFWSYTCINCQRTLPYVKKWHKKYEKRGLVIVGVHAPEFEFEGDIKNIKKAVQELEIKYPVFNDAEKKLWDEYDNHYWPAKYIIDKEGNIVYVYFGEGGYEKTEKMIQELLGVSAKTERASNAGYIFDQSPETYAGFERNQGLGSGLVCDEGGCNFYVDPGEHDLNVIYPDGRWEQEKQYLETVQAPAKISYRFVAREVNLVVEPLEKSVKADVFLDGKKKVSSLEIGDAKMYNIYKKGAYEEHDIAVVFHGKVRVYAYTFG